MFLGMCPCSPYDRESPRDSVSTLGSMSALPAWAGYSAPLGGTPGRERHTFPNTPQSDPNVFSFLGCLFLTFCGSVYLPIIGPCSEYEAWFKTTQTVSKRPGCIAGVCLLWFNFTDLISQNCICAKKERDRNDKAEHRRVIPSVLIKEQLRFELGNQSLTQTRKTAQRPE